MIRGEVFALALATWGYFISGWTIAIAAAICFWVILTIVNRFVILRVMEWTTLDPIWVFQISTWCVAIAVGIMALAFGIGWQ